MKVIICLTIFLNFSSDYINKCLCTTDMEDTDEKMSDSLANQQQNDGPQFSGEISRSKQPMDCGNYGADSEDDSSEPKGKVSISKSKVNSCFLLAIIPV